MVVPQIAPILLERSPVRYLPVPVYPRSSVAELVFFVLFRVPQFDIDEC